jgi:cell division protein FtsA
MVTIPPIAEEERDAPNQVSRAQLTRIIRPRVEETLELIRDRLAKSGFADAVGKRLVLTGGASQLNGMSEVARRILSRNVRLGRPMGVSGMPEAAKGPGFATAVGLLIYPQISKIENFGSPMRLGGMKMTGTGGPLERFGNWIRESF